MSETTLIEKERAARDAGDRTYERVRDQLLEQGVPYKDAIRQAHQKAVAVQLGHEEEEEP